MHGDNLSCVGPLAAGQIRGEAMKEREDGRQTDIWRQKDSAKRGTEMRPADRLGEEKPERQGIKER